MAEIEGGSPVAELVAALVAARAARVLAGAPGPTAAGFSGAIGAGKTTTIRLVAHALAARGFSVATVPERLPAHLFAKYLADPAAHAWLFQAAMAHLRAHDAYDAFEQDVDFLLFERYIGEDGVFFDANVASGTIDLAAHPEYAAEYAAITGSAETYFRARCALFVSGHTTFGRACARPRRRAGAGATARASATRTRTTRTSARCSTCARRGSRRRRMRGAGASSPLTTARTARCTCPRVK